jgi:hypothetical protein
VNCVDTQIFSEMLGQRSMIGELHGHTDFELDARLLPSAENCIRWKNFEDEKYKFTVRLNTVQTCGTNSLEQSAI